LSFLFCFFYCSTQTSDFFELPEKKRTAEPPDRPVYRFFPVPRRFARFFTGSLAERFCTLTGPDAGPVPGLTGPTDQSGPILTTLLLSMDVEQKRGRASKDRKEILLISNIYIYRGGPM
jgi:hypothetical protein